MSFKMKDVTDMILPIGALILGYISLTRLLPTKEYDPSKPCPRGQRYSRGYFEDCDPGYVDDGALFNAKCVCDAATATPTQLPPDQAEPPTPVDSSGRCSVIDFYNPLSPCFLKSPNAPANFPAQAPQHPVNNCGTLDFYNPLSPCFLGIRTPTTPPAGHAGDGLIPGASCSPVAHVCPPCPSGYREDLFGGVTICVENPASAPLTPLPTIITGEPTSIGDLLANPTPSMIERAESIAEAKAVLSEGGTRRPVRFYYEGDGWQTVWKTEAEISAQQANVGAWSVRF